MNRDRYIQEHTHALDGVLRDISPRPAQDIHRLGYLCDNCEHLITRGRLCSECQSDAR